MAETTLHAKLDPVSFGLAVAIPWAVGVALMSFAASQMNWGVPFIELMQSLYLGYAATFTGALIGAAWALADGFIFGALIAWLYNRLAARRG